MPVNLTADPTNGATNPPVVAPVNLTDLASAESVIAGLQPLADRAAYLGQTLFSTGVPRVARVASLAALAAIDTTTGVADRDLRLVAGTQYFGLYQYVAALSASIENLIIAPTTGPGAWVNVMLTAIGVANGFAGLSSDLRVVQLPYNAVISADTYAASVALFTTGATSFTDITGANITIGYVQAGDVVDIDAVAVIAVATGSGNVHTRLSLVENGGSPITPAEAIAQSYQAAAPSQASIACRHTVTVSGPLVATLQAACDSGTTGGFTVTSLRAFAVRP